MEIEKKIYGIQWFRFIHFFFYGIMCALSRALFRYEHKSFVWKIYILYSIKEVVKEEEEEGINKETIHIGGIIRKDKFIAVEPQT